MFICGCIQSTLSIIVIRLSDVVRSATIDQQSALGLPDLGNTFVYIKFYRLAERTGLNQFWVLNCVRDDSKALETAILLCKNRLGYKKLCRIVSMWMA